MLKKSIKLKICKNILYKKAGSEPSRRRSRSNPGRSQREEKVWRVRKSEGVEALVLRELSEEHQSPSEEVPLITHRNLSHIKECVRSVQTSNSTLNGEKSF